MKHFRTHQKQILAAALLVVFGLYFWFNKADFSSLRNVGPGYLALVGLGYVGIVITNGLFIQYVVRPFKVRLSMYESTRVSLISSLGNFFASSGAGLGFRAIYLKKRHGLAYGDYITTLYGNYLLIFIVNAVAGLTSLALAPQRSGVIYWLAVAAFCSLLTIATMFCFVAIKDSKKQSIAGKIQRSLHMMTSGWRTVAQNKKLLFSLGGLIAGQLVLTMAILYFEVVALGITVSISGLLFLSVLGALSVFINVTPANLGIKEGVYILSASIVGLTTNQILSVAIIDRGVLFITLGLLWLIIGINRTGQEAYAA